MLSDSLAKIMFRQVAQIKRIVAEHPKPQSSRKADGSPVTLLDLALSEYIESLMNEHFPNTTFYSEEKFSKWDFPLLALDPLDGTREYVEGRNEWAISIGFFADQKFSGEGWVYNPMTDECFTDVKKVPFVKKSHFYGEVSRSEWKDDLFKNVISDEFSVRPIGSIAYKLGRLAAGKSDFVVSLKPKNIWDIAGGTLLCQQAGFKFYSKGKLVDTVESSYEPPLIWCHEEIFSKLSEIYR